MKNKLNPLSNEVRFGVRLQFAVSGENILGILELASLLTIYIEK